MDIYQDHILNAAANSASVITQTLRLSDEDWDKIYEKLIEVLNEILDEPEFKNYN